MDYVTVQKKGWLEVRPGVFRHGQNYAFFCAFCHQDAGRSHGYMVKYHVWKEGTKNTLLEERGGICCWSCLEQKLQRDLNRDDLTKAPLNFSPEVLKRLDETEDMWKDEVAHFKHLTQSWKTSHENKNTH
jgi:hypothetical protein